MGARLSILAPAAPTIAVSSYIEALYGVQYVDTVNNLRFLKTIKAIDKTNGSLVVVKVLIKPTADTYVMSLSNIIEFMAQEARDVVALPNILPYTRIIETERAGYMIRQYLKLNLYDRLSLRPFLEPIEKLFLVYQAIKTVNCLHEINICHGDLRLENFLVTSWNWLMLSDLSSYTKPVFLPQDNPTEFSFYFDGSGRRVCYLAPERFIKDKQVPQSFDEEGNYVARNKLTKEMDLFSLGCVIGEIYMDGEPLFTLSQIYQYMRGEYIPELTITDPMIKKMVLQLIDLDPNSRPSSQDLLNDHLSLFPNFFGDFLFDFMSTLNKPFVIPKGNVFVSQSDLKIDYIYDNFDKVVKNLNFIYPSNYKSSSSNICNLTIPGLPNGYSIKSSTEFDSTKLNNKAVIIILNMVFSLIKTMKRPKSKVRACQLIIALSERTHDESKLNRSFPYLCSFLDDYINDEGDSSSPLVVSLALKSITSLIQSVSCITPLNALIFPEYLLPKLANLINTSSKDDRCLIRSTVALCLPPLSTCAKKFWAMSKLFKAEDDAFIISKALLDEDFEYLTSTLLVDNSSDVKMSLLVGILPLCEYFGVDKTNDLILPHLLTYLNDQDTKLRLAFLNSLIDIGPYVGVMAFEQYLLPLLVQTLCDTEVFVILKVLEIFYKVLARKLINPVTHFNALNIYDEILGSCINLLVYPNEWVRQSILNIILEISVNLSTADRYCFLYPKVKSYLTYDVTTFSWDVLYPCLSRPLTRSIFDLSVIWCMNSSSKSLFWKSGSNLTQHQTIDDFNSMGKSVYALKRLTEVILANGRNSVIPLLSEDKQWLFKLKSIGLEHKDLWKVVVLRDFIIRFSKAGKSTLSASLLLLPSIDISTTKISPRNIFFDICYKTEPVETTSKVLNNHEVTPAPRKLSDSLLAPGKVLPSVQTVEASVFGELETSHDLFNVSSRRNAILDEVSLNIQIATQSNSHHHHIHSTRATDIHKIFSLNSQEVITAFLKHSYGGFDPFILNYLASVDFQPSMEKFSEFGPLATRRLVGNWTPKGVSIGKINTNSTNDVDALTCIALCDTSEFFVTGSESGKVKIWDCNKLEKNVIVKNANLLLNLQSPIKYIKFIPRRFTFAVSTADGCIKLYNIVVARNKNKRIIKYSNCSLVRQFKDNSCFINFDFIEYLGKNLLIGITSASKLLAIDIIKMEVEFELQNPLLLGYPTAFVVNEKECWVLVGTSKGYISFWDLRFSTLIKTWRIIEGNNDRKKYPINQLIIYQDGFCVVGGTGEPDISIWSMKDFQCKCVLGSFVENPRIKLYNLEEIEQNFDQQIMKFLHEEESGDSPDNNEVDDNSMTFILHSGKYLISANRDRKIIAWNLDDAEKSVSFNAAYDTHFTKTQVNSGLSIINERCKLDKKKVHVQERHLDLITGICTSAVPYEMIISIDRNGYIHCNL